MGRNDERGSWRGRGGRGRGRPWQTGQRGSGFRGNRPGRGGGSAGDIGGNEPHAMHSVVGPRLAEVDVGIAEYLSTHEGFQGVIKERFSDFHVNEIDCDGSVVKLTNFETPKVPEPTVEIPERHELIPEDIWTKLVDLSKKCENPSDPGVQEKKFTPKMEEETICEQDLKGTSHASSSMSVELEVTDIGKDSRRMIHTCIKQAFPKIVSNTKDRKDKKYIVCVPSKNSERQDRRSRWPKERGGEYLYFVVHKRNMDTTETVNTISNKLRIKPSMLTYAGTKDRRGITSQNMCLWRGDPSRLFYISKGIRNISLGNYSFRPKVLRLGDLKGNQFRIAIRNVTGTDEQIETAMSALRKNGFLNYYGLQRFGTNIAVPTHEVGKAMLQGNWKKAVDLILYPRNDHRGDSDVINALKEWADTHDAAKALSKVGNGANSLEGSLLKGLAKSSSNDFVGALSSLPRNTRLMYLHAYQSLVWNKVASRRIQEYGLRPIVGDLVFVESSLKQNSPEVVDEAVKESIDDSQGTVCDTNEVESDNYQKLQVRSITAEELSSIRMENIVLPIPGHDIIYPDNNVKNWYLDILKEDGLTPEALNSNIRDYSLRGAYRKLVAQADNVNWKIIPYSNTTRDFILSDLDEIMGKQISDDGKEGKFKALVVTMCLDPSTYATMALREIMKCDTSATNQASIAAAASQGSQVSEEAPVTASPSEEPQDNEMTDKSSVLSSDSTEIVEEKISSVLDRAENVLKRKCENVPSEDQSQDKKLKTEVI